MAVIIEKVRAVILDAVEDGCQALRLIRFT